MNKDALRIALLTQSVDPRGGVVHTLELAGALSSHRRRLRFTKPSAERNLHACHALSDSMA